MIEINTLPGLSPGFSDLCVIANAEGLTYQDIILEILYLGAARWNLLPAKDYVLDTAKIAEFVPLEMQPVSGH